MLWRENWRKLLLNLMWSKIKTFFTRHERRVSSGALVLGFIVDSLTLRRVDLYAENLALIAYVAIIALAIILLNVSEEKNWGKRFLFRFHPIFLIGMQFAIGGIFSAFLVFYSRSATFGSSWPFLLLLFAQLIGNEILREKYARLQMQVSLLYFVLFSYLIFLVPVLLKRIGSPQFVLSGFLSLFLIFLFVRFLKILTPIRLLETKRKLIWAVGGVFFVINVLYFTNSIPPIPLVLKESGVYHSVTRQTDGAYVLSGEKRKLGDFFRSYQPFYVKNNAPVYAFSAIFAPTEFSLRIFHNWEYFDFGRKKWMSFGRIALPINGGREGGYRTYSVKNGLTPGLWRINLETKSGQIIGRLKFEIFSQ